MRDLCGHEGASWDSCCCSASACWSFSDAEAYREEPAERVVEAPCCWSRCGPCLKLVTVGRLQRVYTYEEALDTYDWLKQFTPSGRRPSCGCRRG